LLIGLPFLLDPDGTSRYRPGAVLLGVVVVIAAWRGVRAGIASATVSTFIVWYSFTQPRSSWKIDHWEDVFSLAVYALTATLVLVLVARLVDSAGTLYLERERKRDALRVVHAVAEALSAGQVVAIFPEGTTSTGHGLLPFHANLLQAAIATATPVQPVALRFSEAANAVSEAVEFVGATSLLRSLWQTSCGEGVRVRLAFLAPRPSAHIDRRELAALLRADLAAALGIDPDAAPALPA